MAARHALTICKLACAGTRLRRRYARHYENLNLYLDWVCVSVVVVVTGAGTVVCCVVVVELCVALSVSQPVSDKRAAVAKQAMISFFIRIIVFGLLLYKHEITQSVDHRLWGITLPHTSFP